jgi:hypothetical protein
MPFTDDEFRDWHRAKQEREFKPIAVLKSEPVATCVHCHLPFGINEGVVTEEVALCDICNGD